MATGVKLRGRSLLQSLPTEKEKRPLLSAGVWWLDEGARLLRIWRGFLKLALLCLCCNSAKKQANSESDRLCCALQAKGRCSTCLPKGI